MKKLVLMDFDGTITSKDTLFEIAKSCTSKYKYWLKLLIILPFFGLAFIRIISKQKVKEHFLKVFFGKLDASTFNNICLQFASNQLKQLIRPKALKKIDAYLKFRDDVVIVSASPENWIIPWANLRSIKVIASKLQISDGKITGHLLGLNVNHEEKVKRILQEIDLSKYDEIIAYGDTKGDLPMLNLATKKHFKPFT